MAEAHPAISTPITETEDIAITKKIPTSRFSTKISFENGTTTKSAMYGIIATPGASENTHVSAACRDDVLLLDELHAVGDELRPSVEPARVHRTESRLHVREALVLHVADEERRGQEEHEHDGRLRPR